MTGSKPAIYLGGAINDVEDPHSWRDEIKAEYPHQSVRFLDPLDRFDATASEIKIVDPPADGPNEVTPKEIVHGDLELLSETDGLFVRWQTDCQMAGTPMEIAYCHRAYKIPIVVWFEGEIEDLSPWVRFHADTIGDDPYALIDDLAHTIDTKTITATDGGVDE